MAAILPPELSVALRDRRRAVAARASGRTLDLGGWSDHLDAYGDGVDLQCADLIAADGPYESIVSLVRTPLMADVDRFLTDLRALLAPNGHAYFLEPSVSTGSFGWAQIIGGRLSRSVAGLHLDRDIPDRIRRSGLFVTDLHRFEVASVAAPLRSFVEAWARPPTS